LPERPAKVDADKAEADRRARFAEPS